tara:strand:+ start:825 stop:980 length:156 start_codon:yes stop_codon:yes gene_type:complete
MELASKKPKQQLQKISKSTKKNDSYNFAREISLLSTSKRLNLFYNFINLFN